MRTGNVFLRNGDVEIRIHARRTKRYVEFWHFSVDAQEGSVFWACTLEEFLTFFHLMESIHGLLEEYNDGGIQSLIMDENRIGMGEKDMPF